tara:strand:+ start:5124 stop:5384 length:261 start_codon:yes stop_codon:yes gene_type:complete
MGDSHRGKNNPMYGKTHSEESKKKMSEVKKGNKFRLGTIQTDEVKAKISRTQRAKYLARLEEEKRKRYRDFKEDGQSMIKKGYLKE